MKRFAPALLLLLLFSLKIHSQYADLGTGNLKNYIWWFDWNGFTISNGATRTINTPDGLTATITFSNVQGPVFTPSVMNTWYGSVLHFLYDFSNNNIKPALYSPYTTQNSQFTVTITATRNGVPAGFKFVAADAEASALSEVTTLTTNGSNWLCIDFFRNSSQTTNPFTGCNTNTAIITDTYGGGSSGLGQNPVIATDAAGSGTLAVNCSFNRNGIDGQMGIAFGIFSPVDRGDLPPSYGYANHRLSFSNNNSCNYLPPLPSLTQSESLKLGAIAGDADATESLNDNTVGADEDAVVTFPLYTNSGSYSVPVNLSNTTGGDAYLTGWFDFNRNGIFDNNEYVTSIVPNNATTSSLNWTGLPTTLPPGTATGWAFRLRLSSDIASTQNPTGFAPDGEVEDYFATSLQLTSANFSIPDTVCVNTPVTITNTSTNATTCYWNFCSGSLNTNPAATSFTSPNISMPVFMDIVQDGASYYVFVVNHGGSLARMDFGNSLLNTPVTTNLGSFGGIIPPQAEGLDIRKDGNNWVGYLIGGQNANSRLVKLDFGASVANTPTANNLGNIGGLSFPVDFTLIQDASNWYGFTVSADNNTITRYNFGSSLNNAPTATNLGNIGGLNYPVGFSLLKDGANYHLFVTNRNSNSVSRLDFGTSITNIPTGINLGNPGNNLTLPRDITLLKDCGNLFGFVTNEGNNTITRLDFNNNVLAAPVAASLGNTGNLNFPHSISEIFRTGDAVNFFIPNVNSNTISRLTFSNCTTSSIPSHIGPAPPAVTYTIPGTYNINLTIDDGLPTQASICKQIVVLGKPDIDFNYQLNACNPLSVQFNGIGTDTQNPYWSFGDATINAGNLSPVHLYPSQNNYTVSYTAGVNASCPDTVVKTISISIVPDNIIRTADTTICLGTTKQLLTQPALSFCWTPTTYLSDPASANPITSPPQSITYYYTAEVTGNNLIVNGDFSQGNTGFSSEYNYTPPPNLTEAQYYVGTSPQAWNGGLNPCGDHTSGNANMMMINGSPVPDVNVWKQTIIVTPNTNYAFSTWIQALGAPNPAQLKFSINNKDVGTLITASLPACTWTQFYTTWNSGNNTTAVISIVNKNTAIQGNDFALDDISFAPVFIKRDSVRITVDTPYVKTTDDVAVCVGIPVQLNTTGAVIYSWTPTAGLSNTAIANPVATPANTTQYVVTGINVNGCTEDDTVTITINPKPTITITPATTICRNTTIQLSATGGGTYAWTPSATLSDPAIANPVASPAGNTKYYVTVTGTNTCTNTDSVTISIHPDPVFNINNPAAICEKETIQLLASGGDSYTWQPDPSLTSTTIANPVASPATTTTYSVLITENTCNNSATLQTTVTVNPLPDVQATSSNDIDCSNDRSQLNATGAAAYVWSPSATLSNPSVANPVATPASNTKYLVKGTDINGCVNYDSVIVNFLAINVSGYNMPNAFTPNGDGLNDCYGIKYWGVIQELEFSIFNRWGERIFFSKDPDACWDGTYKGEAQDIGVYVFMIKAKTLCGDTFKKGLFTLVR